MYITQQLAQQIVDRTMAILSFNINVMDQEGRIIGSGDKSRINTKHEVACEVIRRKETIEIESSDTTKWSGVKEGINLPIVFKNEVVGVVGITGIPDHVKGYGQLVKMTAEMIMEQSYLQKQLQLDKRLKEEVIHQLLVGKDLDDHLLLEKANMLGIDLSIPRVIVIVKSDMKKMRTSYILEQQLSKVIDEQDLLIRTYSGEIIILKRISLRNDHWDYESTLKSIRVWMSQLTMVDKSIKMAIGQHYPTYKRLNNSYKTAKETLKVGQAMNPAKGIFFYHEYSFYVLINELTTTSENNPFFDSLIKLKQQDTGGELQKTLNIYINENGKVNNVASKLHIHRNSLQYRLEKIKDITGKDPRVLKDLFEIYLSMIIDQLC